MNFKLYFNLREHGTTKAHSSGNGTTVSIVLKTTTTKKQPCVKCTENYESDKNLEGIKKHRELVYSTTVVKYM